VGRKYLGPLFAVAGSSFFFALLHGHLASLPALFTLAVCLALAYEKSGSLLVPMVMHATFNTISVLAILYLL
jgi:membrane protease YdiL (CAAX protease family)